VLSVVNSPKFEAPPRTGFFDASIAARQFLIVRRHLNHPGFRIGIGHFVSEAPGCFARSRQYFGSLMGTLAIGNSASGKSARQPDSYFFGETSVRYRTNMLVREGGDQRGGSPSSAPREAAIATLVLVARVEKAPRVNCLMPSAS
jgi:hypothetical protein